MYKEVIREPAVQEASNARGVPSLIADLRYQTVALFDIRVVDTDAPSYSHRNAAAILLSAEEEDIL